MKMSTHDLVLCALCAAVTCVLAPLSVPLAGEVPISLATFAVLLSGILLGGKLGALSEGDRASPPPGRPPRSRAQHLRSSSSSPSGGLKRGAPGRPRLLLFEQTPLRKLWELALSLVK